MKIFTIRMFTATKTGHDFIYERVELSDDCGSGAWGTTGVSLDKSRSQPH